MWKKTLGKPKPASHDGRAAQPASSQMSHARGTTRRTLLGRRGHEHDQSENPVKRQCSFLEGPAKQEPATKVGQELPPPPSQSGDSTDAAISGEQPGQEEPLKMLLEAVLRQFPRPAGSTD
ncbi:uncharacterized protein LOC109282780 [Alligator mississippiensis]|uniref:uncharacterized protein LOC109282780 n=1 Tax=Alligator mississippiensis TaxID=8496 RepID=UPI0028780CF4|nr:uncharacterized protein LOC109282780 [Alligator mississippiensis]